MAEHVFTGFGFGPIQSGLFVKEAFQSGNFKRIVVAEIDQKLVDALRKNNGSYYVNVAKKDSVEALKIENVELLNPNVEEDRVKLLEALGQSTEIATSLPAVRFFDAGGENSVSSLIGEGLKNSKTDGTIIYTAENNNHAAEVLEECVTKKTGPFDPGKVQFLNTVIGKMSGVISDAKEMASLGLEAMSPDIERAFLVEEFNRILVTKTTISGFKPGIEVFIEKDDLLPFEEAKLYGHNAIHALLAYLAAMKGYKVMTELKDDTAAMRIARDAFLGESGTALIGKYRDLGDDLFTEAGYKDYAEDLLVRMTNPYLNDLVARAARDPVRKLGADDRIFGTMTVALEMGVEPVNMALGAMAGIVLLIKNAGEYELPCELRVDDWHELDDLKIEAILNWIWKDERFDHRSQLVEYTQKAKEKLKTFRNE